MKVLLLTLTLALSCFAGEFAVLSTGFRLHADHHEFAGSSVRLYQKDGGYSELGASMVTGKPTATLIQPTPNGLPALSHQIRQ